MQPQRPTASIGKQLRRGVWSGPAKNAPILQTSVDSPAGVDVDVFRAVTIRDANELDGGELVVDRKGAGEASVERRLPDNRLDGHRSEEEHTEHDQGEERSDEWGSLHAAIVSPGCRGMTAHFSAWLTRHEGAEWRHCPAVPDT